MAKNYLNTLSVPVRAVGGNGLYNTVGQFFANPLEEESQVELNGNSKFQMGVAKCEWQAVSANFVLIPPTQAL